jgi:hypothetical protein
MTRLMRAGILKPTETAIEWQRNSTAIRSCTTTALICNSGARHFRVSSDIACQDESCRKRCCHAGRSQADGAAAMEHVMPRLLSPYRAIQRLCLEN